MSNELGGFPRSRRARLTPGGTRRTVPRLRREELAELSVVSAGRSPLPGT